MAMHGHTKKISTPEKLEEDATGCIILLALLWRKKVVLTWRYRVGRVEIARKRLPNTSRGYTRTPKARLVSVSVIAGFSDSRSSRRAGRGNGWGAEKELSEQSGYIGMYKHTVIWIMFSLSLIWGIYARGERRSVEFAPVAMVPGLRCSACTTAFTYRLKRTPTCEFTATRLCPRSSNTLPSTDLQKTRLNGRSSSTFGTALPSSLESSKIRDT